MLMFGRVISCIVNGCNWVSFNIAESCVNKRISCFYVYPVTCLSIGLPWHFCKSLHETLNESYLYLRPKRARRIREKKEKKEKEAQHQTEVKLGIDNGIVYEQPPPYEFQTVSLDFNNDIEDGGIPNDNSAQLEKPVFTDDNKVIRTLTSQQFSRKSSRLNRIITRAMKTKITLLEGGRLKLKIRRDVWN